MLIEFESHIFILGNSATQAICFNLKAREKIVIKARVQDQYGNEIYITEERWQHISTGHREMRNNFEDLLKTLRLGKRKQDRENPKKFLYTRRFGHMPPATVMLVVVKFDFVRTVGRNLPNNFVLSAYYRHVK